MKPTRTACVIACLAAAAVVVHAQAPIKILTFAPESSIWSKVLREMAEGWKTRSKGRITYRLLPGGGESEEKLLRNLRLGQSQVAQLSAIALSNMDDAFNVFSLPMFFESFEEADAVLDKLSPILEARLEKQNLKILNWGYVGWIHIFSTQPFTTVDELKKLPLYTSAGDERFPAWYRRNGFNPKPFDASAMLSALTTGQIKAVPITPLSAQIFTWNKYAPYMLDVGFAPFIGATVMQIDRWKTFSADDQRIILEEAKKAGDRMRTEVPRLDKEAVATMQTSGLKVTTGDRKEWRQAGEKFGAAMRADLVPADIYDLALKERDALRKTKGTK